MIITNAKLVLDNEVVLGSVEIVNGAIQSYSQSLSALPSALDAQQQYLLPGFVDLHTDNLERVSIPRPSVHWPIHASIVSHDAQMIAAGITTTFDAISIRNVAQQTDKIKQLQQCLDALARYESTGNNRSSHYIHLRCELASDLCQPWFDKLIDNPLVKLVSVMDHTPGQRQYRSLKQYRQYYQGKYHLNDQQMDDYLLSQQEKSNQWVEDNRRYICMQAEKKGLTIASHDDATIKHIEQAIGLNIAIAEFPTTLEAAITAYQRGQYVLMGAPNIVLGGSQSGNVSVTDVATAGAITNLSSDYFPSSLLEAVFILANDEHNNYNLQQTVAMASKNNAHAARLDDRGTISTGMRADLQLVTLNGKQPLLTKVWRQGTRVF